MSHGHLTDIQREALRPYVTGQVVHDLGSGPTAPLSRVLLNLGAREVIAVDRQNQEMSAASPVNFRYVQSYFEEFTDPVDIAFLSWPSNSQYDRGLVPLCERARLVVYLGHNFDGVVCGSPALFHHLLRRKLLVAVPWRHNSLLVCGEPLARSRKPTPEEAAGLDVYEPGSVIEYFEMEAWKHITGAVVQREDIRMAF